MNILISIVFLFTFISNIEKSVEQLEDLQILEEVN